MMHWQAGSGRALYLRITLEDVQSGSHQGACDDDVQALSRRVDIAEQTAQWDSAELAAELKEYGAWDATELADHDQNIQRMLWLACGDITENPEHYSMIDASKYTAHTRPGKFEGESPATEYFYDQMCEGEGESIYAGGDENGEGAYCANLFQIDVEESDAFGLPLHHWFLLREDSQGFAIGSVYESRDAAEKAFNDWAGV